LSRSRPRPRPDVPRPRPRPRPVVSRPGSKYVIIPNFVVLHNLTKTKRVETFND
jgi:hypothetical protein